MSFFSFFASYCCCRSGVVWRIGSNGHKHYTQHGGFVHVPSHSWAWCRQALFGFPCLPALPAPCRCGEERHAGPPCSSRVGVRSEFLTPFQWFHLCRGSHRHRGGVVRSHFFLQRGQACGECVCGGACNGLPRGSGGRGAGGKMNPKEKMGWSWPKR
ncbi:hypothetical protein Tc00.1047053505183.110 [Trypanosoma cruzi]|uniref:Uncharacterized protein n=1 Tax=Trypanosoma cruzi (strain CL Brener) TaxID=353153 RepID=Q4DJ60_TRYCC|nr:hypothetical protein Tc00.1047053505183.110 [Trypanosoma cruzi]EAN92566.1 hypothetical protein Tc00.1047053505183.110 [Trypanosoma cruzi]|eukprot:XP_814417.1 hypothetical protein [Trypanosoma cruzi strain CL Brener]